MKKPEACAFGFFVVNETVPAEPVQQHVGKCFDISPRNAYRTGMLTARLIGKWVKPRSDTHTSTSGVKKHQSLWDCTYILYVASADVKVSRVNPVSLICFPAR